MMTCRQYRYEMKEEMLRNGEGADARRERERREKEEENERGGEVQALIRKVRW